MNLRIIALCLGFAFAAVHCAVAAAGKKKVHLRNELIYTEGRGEQTPDDPELADKKTGLFLIQFEEGLKEEQRAVLQAEGITLLQYVPDDTFVARLGKTPLGQIRRLPFVRWVGKYNPAHKVHKKVKESGPNEEIAISVLFASDTDEAEFGRARGLFRRLSQESRPSFGKILKGRIAAAQVDFLAASDAVLWIEPAPNIRLFDEVATVIVAGEVEPHITVPQSYGFDGAGVTVAVADSGLDSGEIDFMHPDIDGRVEALFYYGALSDASDEHSHGTHVAGIVAGNAATGEVDENGALYGLGVAPGAGIIAQRIFDAVGNYEAPPSFETLTRDAVQAGAEIGSNSWGDDTHGRYDISAAEFDALVRDADAITPGDQQYILEFSAGNAGPGIQTIGSPAVGKNVIATGASQNNRTDEFIFVGGQEAMAYFSSRGPCEDGRIKPDLVAPGSYIASLRSVYANDDFAWAPISDYYMYQGGTSQAGPHASGAAAIFYQYYRSLGSNAPSPALVKAALVNAAIDMDDSVETGPVPNMDEGWGRLDLTSFMDAERVYQWTDQTHLLISGRTYEKYTVVHDRNIPLFITLAYTDVPGFPGALPALVNDLDLEVIAPDGSVYLGNQFDEGDSYPGAVGGDRINNVECVYLNTPQPGEYLIRVRGYNIVQDARTDTPSVDQDFALVVSANIPKPGEGIVFFDRAAYTAPSQIRLGVMDLDLAGAPFVDVRVQSTTEPGGETVRLTPVGRPGSFSGMIPVRAASPVVDGMLQVSHGDTIEAFYNDQSRGVTVTAAVPADLVPPIISSLEVRYEFGRMIASWVTDEPATSFIRYGSNAPLAQTVSSAKLRTEREIPLPDLVNNLIYSYWVSSSDAAGNATTNNNNGAFHEFLAITPPLVLLVDMYVDELFTVPPLSGYTDALDQTGVSYEIWDSSRPSPEFEDLAPYKAVIWRVPEFFTDGLSSLEQNALARYLTKGGSFLIASMELPSRLDENGGTAFRTNVLRIPSYLADDQVSSIVGVSQDPIAHGINVSLDYTPYEDELKDFIGMPSDVSDALTPGVAASAIFREGTSSRFAGLRYPRTGVESAGRFVYLSFPLDTIPMSEPAPNNRPTILRRIIEFLIPGLGGGGAIAMDSPSYTLPDFVAIEVADTDLVDARTTTIQVWSDLEPARKQITLQETRRKGVFRGAVFLRPSSAPTGAGVVRALPGQRVYAAYFDASLGREVLVSALVDTTAPVISNVQAAADYEEALIGWDTSEEADALVQYGESPFLGKTATSPEFTIAREVQLNGLNPDRLYYYKVVSRDVAGNVFTDDNNGALYTFRTARPIFPPFVDDLENDGSNWSIFSSDDSQVEWTLGPPNNGVETSANSPVNAWGSNLNGESIDAADTFLISPAIQLVGGNTARVRFWHSYDFLFQNEFDIVNGGELLLFTNNVSDPINLGVWTDDYSLGWESVEIDLTPYIGRVINLVWHYSVLSFDTGAKPGWLVDDVSITVDTIPTGTITITNNIAGGSFQLTGAASRTGRGFSNTFANLPTGSYSITFRPAPYYNTPPPQNVTLNASASINVAGIYTFADSNANGMPDVWEQDQFGSISPQRTRTTDTDGDGMTDFAEFQAGTNPQSAASVFSIKLNTQGSGFYVLNWGSSSVRSYRVESSVNGIDWAPVSSWTSGNGTTMSHVIPIDSLDSSRLFRVKVHP